MNAPKISKVVKGLAYNTETAELLADDVYWDGHNFERNGRNTFLYRTPKGRFFTVTLSMWQGEQDTLQPLTTEEAKAMWEALSEQYVDYADAFGAPAEEAQGEHLFYCGGDDGGRLV